MKHFTQWHWAYKQVLFLVHTHTKTAIWLLLKYLQKCFFQVNLLHKPLNGVLTVLSTSLEFFKSMCLEVSILCML